MLTQHRQIRNQRKVLHCQLRTSSSCSDFSGGCFYTFQNEVPCGFSILLFIFFQPRGNAVLSELEELSRWHFFNRNKRKGAIYLTCVHHFRACLVGSLLTCNHEQLPQMDALYFRKWVVSGRYISGIKDRSESCCRMTAYWLLLWIM